MASELGLKQALARDSLLVHPDDVATFWYEAILFPRQWRGYCADAFVVIKPSDQRSHTRTAARLSEMAHVPPGGAPFSWGLLGFGVLCAWAVLYHRGLPLYFHLRVLSYVVRAIMRPQPFSRADEEIVLHERVWLSDVDFNIHCNNAVYNNLLDFARFKWFMRLAGECELRSQQAGAVRRRCRQVRVTRLLASTVPFCAGDDILGNFSRTKVGNGGVTMFFLRELRPFQPFRIRTRVLGFDRKWVFYMHIFESGRDNKVRVLWRSRVQKLQAVDAAADGRAVMRLKQRAQAHRHFLPRDSLPPSIVCVCAAGARAGHEQDRVQGAQRQDHRAR